MKAATQLEIWMQNSLYISPVTTDLDLSEKESKKRLAVLFKEIIPDLKIGFHFYRQEPNVLSRSSWCELNSCTWILF